MTANRQRADEWAVVLAAAGIPHWMRHRLDGWALIVSAADAARALEALEAYDLENVREAHPDPTAPSRPLTTVGLVVALSLIGFFAITGPRAGRSAWIERGSADATRMLAGEWWRALTALTLHADAPHVLGNAVAGALLITAVCWHLGPGVGLWLLLLAGIGGNLLTAAVHGANHTSVGASTAIFGAIGVLAMLRIVSPGRVGPGGRRSWVVVAATVALLGLLGTAPHTDLLAHVFGLLVGGGLGPIGALTLRWAPPQAVQWVLVIAAGAAVAGAWRLAF